MSQITDAMACDAVNEAKKARGEQIRVAVQVGSKPCFLDTSPVWPEQILHAKTGIAVKKCFRALERASRKGLIEYGVSVSSGWLTRAGKELLDQEG